MNLVWIFLVLIAVVLVFGIGVIVVNRSRGGGTIEAPPRPEPTAPPTPPPQVEGPSGTAVAEAPGSVTEPTVEELEAALAEGALVEEPVLAEPEILVRPRFRDRLTKARASLALTFSGVRGRPKIDDETWEDLEEALLKADVGVKVTMALLDDLQARVTAKEITDPDQLLDALKADMKERLASADRSLAPIAATAGSPEVWLFVGVNGVGKTTTIGKVGNQLTAEGHTVVMAAGDTFRAAAAEQLGTWAERAGAELVRGAEGGDPSAIIFDAVQRAAARGYEVVLADTAGRLHTKTNLMEELRKVRRVADKEPGKVTEVLLVLDATTGQNGLRQAVEFTQATEVTGVVLTKLDGSAKGGIVFAIQTELGIPVKLVGLGETIADLVPFDPDEFVDALFE
jgi:fused signal recognition particle receptor